jgi:hypothetical protein
MSETIHDALFGNLTWDPMLEYWEGVLLLPGRPSISVSISVPEETAERTITKEARDAFSVVISQEDRIKRKASQDLLALYNDGWRRDGDVLSADEFERRLTLKSIHLNDWGAADIYFDDGDLFWGHLVIVEMEPDGTFEYKAKFEG